MEEQHQGDTIPWHPRGHHQQAPPPPQAPPSSEPSCKRQHSLQGSRSVYKYSLWPQGRKYLALGAGNPKLPSLPVLLPAFTCLAGMDLVLQSAELRDFSFEDLPPAAENRLMCSPCGSALLPSAVHASARLSTHHVRALFAQGQTFAVFTVLSHTGAAVCYKHAPADSCLHVLRPFAVQSSPHHQ